MRNQYFIFVEACEAFFELDRNRRTAYKAVHSGYKIRTLLMSVSRS